MSFWLIVNCFPPLFISFCQTYAEQKAPNSEWKIVWGLVILGLSVTCWVYCYMRNNVYDAMLPATITKEYQEAVVSRWKLPPDDQFFTY